MKQMAVGLRVAVPSLVVAFLVAACGSADGMPEGSAAVDAPAPEEAVDIAADSEASPEADTSSVGTGNGPAATGDPTAVATASLDSIGPIPHRPSAHSSSSPGPTTFAAST